MADNMVEFVVAANTSLNPAELRQRELKGAMFPAGSTHVLTRGPVIVVSRNLAERRAIFDGVAVHRGELVTEPPGGVSAREFVRAARGLFTLVEPQPEGVDIYVDTLSLYNLYVWQDGNRFVCSNNAHLVATTLEKIGVPVRRSVEHFAHELSFANGLDSSTAYEDVRLAPFAKMIKVGRSIEYVDFPGLQLYEPRDLLDQARNEIQENVRAVADHPFRARVCYLSGGYDSRLMLAAVLAVKAQDAFVYRTGGTMASADGNVAALLRYRFKLKRVAFVPVPHAPAVDRLEARRRALFRTMGSIYNGIATSIGYATDHSVGLLNGGLGETFRGSLHREVTGHPRDLLTMQIRVRSGRFIREDLVQKQVDFVERFFAAREGMGFGPFEALDQFYIEQRNPQFMGRGGRVRLALRHLVYPLYSPAAIATGQRLSAAERGANRLGFQLIRQMKPELAELPFAEKTWLREAYAGDPDGDRIAAVRSVKRNDPPLIGVDRQELVRLPERTSGERGTDAPDPHEQALLDKGFPRSQAALASSLASMRELLDEGVFSGSTDIDEGGVREFVDRPPADFSASEAKIVERLLRGSLWLAGREIEDPLVIIPAET